MEILRAKWKLESSIRVVAVYLNTTRYCQETEHIFVWLNVLLGGLRKEFLGAMVREVKDRLFVC